MSAQALRTGSRVLLAFAAQRPGAALAASLLGAIAIAAALAPLIAPQNPFDLASFDVLDAELPPSCLQGSDPRFLLGTDAQGRDHNPQGFTVWLAGAGVKKGFSYGATDEFGYRAVDKVATIYDFHATILHLLGLDHERLSYYHNGIERRLTDVYGRVLHDLLA